MKIAIDISFQPDWPRIENLRHGLETVLATGTYHDDDKAVIAMVSAELLENAFKHGERGASPVDFSLLVEDDRCTVTVTNQCGPDNKHNFERLLATLQWIESFDNPLLAYIERMKTLYTATDEDSAGLGLLRIAYEGRCEIKTELNSETRTAKVQAIFNVVGKRHEQ